MQTKSSLQSYKAIDETQVNAYLDRAAGLVRENLPQFQDCFPDSNSIGNFYPPL